MDVRCNCEVQSSERFVSSSSNYNVDNNNMFASDTEWWRHSEGVIRSAGGSTDTVRFDLTLGSIETYQQLKEYNDIIFRWIYPPDTLHASYVEGTL